jgi:hypothetical protein
MLAMHACFEYYTPTICSAADILVHKQVVDIM